MGMDAVNAECNPFFCKEVEEPSAAEYAAFHASAARYYANIARVQQGRYAGQTCDEFQDREGNPLDPDNEKETLIAYIKNVRPDEMTGKKVINGMYLTGRWQPNRHFRYNDSRQWAKGGCSTKSCVPGSVSKALIEGWENNDPTSREELKEMMEICNDEDAQESEEMCEMQTMQLDKGTCDWK